MPSQPFTVEADIDISTIPLVNYSPTLYDLNRTLSTQAFYEGGPFYKQDGFTDLFSSSYFVESDYELKKQLTHVLRFNGKNQGLMLSPAGDPSPTPYSPRTAMTLAVKFGNCNLARTNVGVAYAFCSTAGQPNNFDNTLYTATTNDPTGFNLALVNIGTPIYPIYRLKVSYGGQKAVEQASYNIYEGVWYFIAVSYDESVLRVSINGTFIAQTPLTVVHSIDGSGALILGAQVRGDAADSSLAVINYFEMYAATLDIWMQPDINLVHGANLLWRTRHPTEYLVNKSISNVETEFYQDSRLLTYSYRFTPRNNQCGYVINDELKRNNASMVGKDNEYLTEYDSEADTNVVVLDGYTQYIKIPNKGVFKETGTQFNRIKRFPTESRNGLLSDLNQNFTAEMWVRPCPFFEDFLNSPNNSFFSERTSAILGSMLFSNSPLNYAGVDNYLNLTSNNLEMSGIFITVGKFLSSIVFTGFVVYTGSSGESIASSASVSLPYVDISPWYNVQFVLDYSNKNAALHITPRMGGTTTDTSPLDGVVSKISNFNDFYGSPSLVSDYYIGATQGVTEYSYNGRTFDLLDAQFKGKIVDVKLWKVARTVEQLNNSRYNIVSDL